MKKLHQDKHLKNVIFVSMTSICLVFALLSVFVFQSYKFNISRDMDLFMGRLQIVSTAFSHENNIPSLYTCNENDINPPLKIRNRPEGTESFAIIMEDITTNETKTHWTLWNINPDIVDIEENSIPIGAEQGINSFDKVGYTGPCQSENEQKYRFELYALSTVIELTPQATKEDIIQEITPFIIEKAELVGTY